MGMDLEVLTARFFACQRDFERCVTSLSSRTRAASSLVVLLISGQRGIFRGRVGGTENATCENLILSLYVLGGVCYRGIHLIFKALNFRRV